MLWEMRLLTRTLPERRLPNSLEGGLKRCPVAKTQPEDQSLQTPLPKAMFQSRWDHWSAKAIMKVSTFFVITK